MKILIIAYYFPPDSSSGSLRPFFLANHLVALGDEVTILTAKRSSYQNDQTIDIHLIRGLDPRVNVLRTGVLRPLEWLISLRNTLRRVPGASTEPQSANPSEGTTARGFAAHIRNAFSKFLTTPDAQIGWLPTACLAGIRAMYRCQHDMILATGGPWTGLLCGCLIKTVTRRPLALDFRDPWASAPGRDAHGTILFQIHTFLERLSVATADLLILNTNELQMDFLNRYPRLRKDRTITVTNGFEAEIQESDNARNSRLTFLHAGDLYASRDPLPLLEAIFKIVERGTLKSDEILVRFVGLFEKPSESAGRIDELLVSPLIHDAIEICPRVSFGESQRMMMESDVLIVYQPGFPLQIPRKLFDYIGANRTILCVADPGGATWSLVEQWSLGICARNDQSSLVDAIQRLAEAFHSGSIRSTARRPPEEFRNSHLAEKTRSRLMEILKERAP